VIVPLGERRFAWLVGEETQAVVRLVRDGEEVTVEEPQFENESSLRALLDAVAATANTRRLRGRDEVLARCGFERDGETWVRRLRPQPQPAPFVTLGQLEAAIRGSWDRETTEDPDVWSDENPALGNCAVTALVVRDYLGGEIVAAGVVRDDVRVERHAWNRLPSGLMVDLTRDQFRGGEQFEAPEPVETFLSPTTFARYEVLAARVRAKLGGARRQG
jgi:hypothetical protein